MIWELASFAIDVNYLHAREGIFSPGILVKPSVFWPLEKALNTKVACDNLDHYEANFGPVLAGLLDGFSVSSGVIKPGRLSYTIEGGGKRRIFAIGNYVKQRLLYPVHEWAMSVLGRLSCDGTFNQSRPIEILVRKGLKDVYSFDLSSATDRWPLSVIHDTISSIFGQTVASSIVNACLGMNTFYVGPPLFKWKPKLVTFTTGQPLGYYGSWALFALSHHFIVWLAAKEAYPTLKTPFTDYAVLGDDVVIADKAVAHQYKHILGKLGVAISEPKSLESDCGAFEFAKQFWKGKSNLSLVHC